MTKKSLSEVLLQNHVINGSGFVSKDRLSAYNRALAVFNILYPGYGEDDQVIEEPDRFFRKYVFAIAKRNPKSIADHLVNQEILAKDYSVLDQYSLDEWKCFLNDRFQEECDIYEYITKDALQETIATFSEYKEENSSLGDYLYDWNLKKTLAILCESFVFFHIFFPMFLAIFSASLFITLYNFWLKECNSLFSFPNAFSWAFLLYILQRIQCANPL